MRTLTWIGLTVAALGGGIAACSTASVLLGCHNPTGYCGGNTPDPDRVGGPSWFLWQATAEERLSYYSTRCAERDPSQLHREVEDCALESIAQNAHQYCVLYYLPPTRPADDAEEAERDRNFAKCKTDLLSQHNL
ncbi:hypothetical protein [Cognatiyoonia sp. IB215182]|uniref:hypothetical protein n=1 Tax=Cognatiyoonia sp. IB215182 TaxID=3097353 RepID=UPI002A10E7F2|nr:hypothetical protein [Cognatiyoonia sp. IB215182]MDX8352771.1 hypothetical protein [Cognatiyoonia sp. IB215182]